MEVQRPRLVHLLQLLPVPKVQGEVSGDDGFADDLQHLLVLAGAQGGEDVVPFQLQRDQRKTTNSSTPSLKASSATWKQYGWITVSNVTAMTSLGKTKGLFRCCDRAIAYVDDFVCRIPLGPTKHRGLYYA